MIQDPIINQHQHIISLISSARKLNHYQYFAMKYKYFKLIITIQI